ncbi:FAD-binding monooxygenase [Corynebacterium halotolerans]|uniref:Phenol 2-monooxygenase n=1 Tax=Corynebacterium halotolerans YIM 70093 = DSM 44683 TaxID=1121362 RepID=M1MVD0_9CORY|nr:FAD-binding monooxygenase [Corynebacterium halotolerans]AGF71679.1 phenol 2-monooxygenase [Corynebacterium halotolerans YIM 70093 = DSM 44683]
MQFHHHGYVSEDPRVIPAAPGMPRSAELPEEMDVLIVGAGPAGMIAAAQLSMFPGVHTRLIDRRPHRLDIGQADGIQARSVETFQAFGFANEIIDEAYWLTEMAFWNPDPENPENIIRTGRAIDDEYGISEFKHLIVNQARILDHFATFMANSPSRMTPNFGWEFLDLKVAENPDSVEYPVTVELKNVETGERKTVRTKYVYGTDGAKSGVRHAIGCTLDGDQANQAWGVMDVLAKTDFPDIRTKCAIHSSAGSILHIPREGGHLFRMYVDLGMVGPEDKGAIRKTPIETVIEKANAIIHPYSLEVKDVAWSSVYEVGHRVTDRFDNLTADSPADETPRVFIGGDACHTHSAKAGQGMNVSMQDGFNLAWKLGHVVEGRSPKSLLRTYSEERLDIARNLIDFDKQWSRLMATKPEELEDPKMVEEFYVKTAEFPAGFMTEYEPSLITGDASQQELATGYPLGKRFKSAKVVRVCDTNPVHIGHHATADGRWRIYAFADQPAPGQDSKLTRWAEWLGNDPASPVVAHTPVDADEDAYFDVKVIYQQRHTEFNFTDAPRVFRPEVGPFQLTDYEKVYGVLPDEDIFEERGISRDGAVVVVRPDQYVAAILPLDDTQALTDFFNPIFDTTSQLASV